jgi:hypothetical protein
MVAPDGGCRRIRRPEGGSEPARVTDG